ncbi:MAG: putative sulfate exporter family transporter [Candidatus Abyssobacteria bacterium SURF_17]|uniref:Putative sulfate exporter family transporter n=1 Tax=Candidatus Abyssobacteria bacterium SURF_17 TaxID=2093361 RepID=A0A419F1F6_9BACT|nr:MAG: putative sulfate exporter family transporter [Candidatus Abyssubacteria bacterium SURF_17]
MSPTEPDEIVRQEINEGTDVVVERATSQWSDLWKKEDYLAIWLGFIILIVGLLIYLPRAPKGMNEKIAEANSILKREAERAPFKTVAWYKATDAKRKPKAMDEPLGKTITTFTNKPHGWTSNPLQAFILNAEQAEVRKAKAALKYEEAKAKKEAALARAAGAELAAESANFESHQLNEGATAAIDDWRQANRQASDARKKTSVKPYNQFPYLAGLMVVLAVFFSVGIKLMGCSLKKFFPAFVFVFIVAVLAYMMEGQATMKEYGFGYALWAIIFGLIISNTVGTPRWVMPAVQVEYYIKTGLVLLGAEILFGKILAIGIPGIFVAWIVTPIVLVSTFIFGQKVLKITSKTLNITISADMSVCGVSAAIATAAACRAKKEELTLSVGLSMMFTAIMMVVMPTFIKAVGMPHVLGGAWMGGTIDATGAVAAAGAFLSDRALYVAATVKMIQNMLIGVIAFCVAVYWCARVECAPGQRVRAMEIWHRFPKFVLGFIAASIIFSLFYESMGNDVADVMLDQGVLRGFATLLRDWFFCLAFTSIGLATNFRELAHHFKGGKPLILYVCGQSFNLILTLTMAYIMFYKVFPQITAKI